MTLKLHRYPGIRPFMESEQILFFGRKKETEELLTMLTVERLAVLYGKSGVGKSSLLEAGVLPQIKQRHILVIKLRFGAYNGNESETLVTSITRRIKQMYKSPDKPSFFAQLPAEGDSLWPSLKNLQLENQESQAMLLSIDQAEEIFTYPQEMISELRQQLSDAQNLILPKEIRESLRQDFLNGIDSFDNQEMDLLCKPLRLKLLLAIRSDRLSLLSGFLPGLLEQTYELKLPDIQQTREAITQPARLTGENFNSPTFEFEEATIQALLEFLKDRQGGYEPFQLQMLCNHAERIAIHKGGGIIGTDEMGDFAAILENFYEDQLNQFSADEQLPVRRLIEEGLIYEEEERRLSLYEGLIFKAYSIAPETLRKLVESHLLRAEPSLQGGYTYELSHDTLVAPILKAKTQRKREEKQKEFEEQEREREYELKEARQQVEKEQKLRHEAEKNSLRARKRTRLAAVLSILMLVFALISFWSYSKSLEANQLAIKQVNANLAQREELKNQLDTIELLNDAIEKKAPGTINKPKSSINRSKNLLYTVFIQYSDDQVLANDIKDSLKKNGYTVPGIELGNQEYSSSVKYFHQEDSAKAEEIHKYILNNFKVDLKVSYNRHLSSKAPQGQIEVWLP